MANSGVEAFLQVEEEARRLLEELARLKEETDSYKTARKALDQAAEGVSGLASRLGEIAGQLGTVVATLRSIGTPELLRAQQAVTSELALLRQDLGVTQQSVTGTLAAVRNLALGSIGLSLIALALLGWLVLTLARG